MNPSLREQLKTWKKYHQESIPKKPFHKNKRKQNQSKMKKEEKLTRRDLIGLMGMNRPTYKRGKGGAWRSSR